jgi:transcriptional regulator with XRE-family HTH domain
VTRFADHARVVPDGPGIRRRRRERGWSQRDLVRAICDAHERATGKRLGFNLNLLQHVEEESEPIAYATLVLVAAGLDCDPVELVAQGA